MFDPLYYLGVFAFCLTLGFVFLLFVGILSLRFFPTSKLSDWFRRNLITDKDLEP